MSDIVQDGKARSRFAVFVGTEGQLRMGGTTDLTCDEIAHALTHPFMMGDRQYVKLHTVLTMKTVVRDPRNGPETVSDPGETLYFLYDEIVFFATCDLDQEIPKERILRVTPDIPKSFDPKKLS